MTDPGAAEWGRSDPAFRRSEASSLIGASDSVWARATHDVLRWKVKTRSGFRVASDRPAIAGDRLIVTARVLWFTVREPVEVVDVVNTAERVGFSYRTLPGHPVDGEEAFIVHRRGDEILLTVRSLTRAAPEQPWRALHPLLRVAQLAARRRYLRALY